MKKDFQFPFDLKIDNITILISYLRTPKQKNAISIAQINEIKFNIFFFFSSHCRHKRKMPNFWPCKSLPKRNGHLDTSGVSTGAHSVAYEDPDAHLHHHPLVRHHNMEVIVQKIY